MEPLHAFPLWMLAEAEPFTNFLKALKTIFLEFVVKDLILGSV
jgi:hypothetical protein